MSSESWAAARGTLALTAVQLVGRALAVLFVLVATRALRPSEFGAYATVSAMVLVATAAADLGTTAAITREVSASKSRSASLLEVAVPGSIFLGAVAMVAMVAIARVSDFGEEVLQGSLVAAPAVLLDTPLTSLLAALDGHGLIALRARASLARVMIVAVGGALVLLLGLGSTAALAMLPVGSLAAWLIGLQTARQHAVWMGQLRVDARAFSALLRRAAAFATLGLLNVVILRYDIVLLSRLSGASAAGKYDVALRALEGLSFIGIAVAAPSLYLLSRRLATGDLAGAQRAYDETQRFAWVSGSAIAVFLVFLRSEIVEALSGAGYEAASTLLAILAVQLPLAFLAAVQGSLVLAGVPARSAIVTFLGVTAAAVCVDTVAIARWDEIGAAYAMIPIQTFVVLAAAILVRRTVGIRTHLPPWRVVLATGGAVIAGWLVRDMHWALMLFAIAVPYAVLVIATGAVPASDLRRLLAIARRGPPP